MFVSNDRMWIGSRTPTSTDQPIWQSRWSRQTATVRDRQDKLPEYEAAGVPEYWLIDDTASRSAFLRARRRRAVSGVPLGADGIYTSTVLPGLRLRVDWLWRDPLPDLDEALADLPE